MVDVEQQERQRLAARERALHGYTDHAIEIFAVAEARQRIGQALGADCFQALLEIADFVLRQRQPVFQRLVGLAHLAGRTQQRFDDRLDLLAALGRGQLLGRARQAGVVGAGHAERVAQDRHHVVDLADDARADLVDAVGRFDVGEIGVVDLLEIGFGQLAVARQRLVDDLVERSVVAGRVDVPDLVIAGDCGLLQRPDLTERHLGERHRAFVFIEHLDHRTYPTAIGAQPTAAMLKLCS